MKDAYDAFEEYLDETWWEEDCEVEDNMLDTVECKKNVKDKFDISSYIVVSKSKAKKVNSTKCFQGVDDYVEDSISFKSILCKEPNQIVKKHPKGSYTIIDKPVEISYDTDSDVDSDATSSTSSVDTGYESDKTPKHKHIPKTTLSQHTLHCFLHVSDVDPASLVLFYDNYLEAHSRPRQFLIYKFEASVKVASPLKAALLFTEKNFETDCKLLPTFKSFVVTIFSNNVNENELENLRDEDGSLEVSELVNYVFQEQPTKKEASTKKNPSFQEQFTKQNVTVRGRDLLLSGIFEDCSSQLQNNIRVDTHNSINNMHATRSKLQIEPVCPVCLEASSLEDFTCMAACGHLVCNACWKSYLNAALLSKSVVLCPESECESEVDLVTLISFVGWHKWMRHLQKEINTRVLQTDSFKSCTTPDCSAVAKCNNQDNQTGRAVEDIPVVACVCNKTWCFNCGEKSHWPAPCKAFEEYLKFKERTVGHLYDAHGNIFNTNVFVKRCPFCNSQIEKNQGCNFMTCICRRNFCWHCLKPFDNHQGNCTGVDAQEYTFSSLDVSVIAGRKQIMTRALGYHHRALEAHKLMWKFKINKTMNKYTYIEPNHSSRLAVVRRTVNFLEEAYRIMEMMIVAKAHCHSRHTGSRILNFVDRLALNLNSIDDALKVKNLYEVKLGHIVGTAEKAKEQLSKLKTFISH